MAKKELKVKEINELLRVETGPKLDGLRQEERVFLDFKQSWGHPKRPTRLVVAHECVKNKDKVRQSATIWRQ